ncbi:uncharacterized protein LOC133716103 [Rosa rugosa]|uniref:uncharacterized protein LOC133716103 n=1 Tax=Rosa rugosa TaxID=74645 RepID=UPI002B409304|nr:uncharacterized protein LOC133716103 [Rosa rugosa]
MFSSKDWYEYGCTKHKDAYEVRKWIIRDTSFWNHVAYCIKSVLPLFCVLKEVDLEVRPAMGIIFELMDAAKDKIASYYLNPQFRYEDNFKYRAREEGFGRVHGYDVVGEARVAAEIQLDLYEQKLVFWWEKYGTETLELMDFATRVLSLTYSYQKRLHALVYVKYNIAIRDKIEDPLLPADPHWLEDNVEDLTLNDEAVRNVPIGTCQSTLIDRKPPSRVPTPPHEPTPSLDKHIVLYKRKSNEGARSSKRKAPRKSMHLDDIVDDDIRINPYDDTNPLFEHHGDDSDGGDSLGDDSLNGDLLIDEDNDFQR